MPLRTALKPPRSAQPLLVMAVLVALVGGVPRWVLAQQTQLPIPNGGNNAPDNPNNGVAGDEDGDLGDGNKDGDAPDGNALDGNTPNAGANNRAYGGQRPDGRSREAARRAAVEDRLRQILARNGVSSVTTQDAILEFMRQDEQNKENVREAVRNLWNGMRRDAPVERIHSLLTDYQKALQTQHDNRVRAQTALDARVGYTLDPHLESLLWLMGVLGEAQNVLNVPSGPSRRPRALYGAGNGNGAVAVLGTNEQQIDGVVSAKNGANEVLVWLEIRDAQGKAWRMTPQNDPNAQVVLVRQIQGLALGSHVLARVAPSPQTAAPVANLPFNIKIPVAANAPLSLLALIPVADAGQGAPAPNEAPVGQ